MTDQNEPDLIREIIAGNQERFEFFLQDNYQRLQAYIERKLPNWLRETIDAEELLQETHIAAFRSVHQFRGTTEGSLATWLRKIAENKLIDAIRANSRLKRGGANRKERIDKVDRSSSILQLVEQLADDERSIVSFIGAKEAEAAMEVCIASLPNDQRIAINLKLNEKRNSEIAAEMNKSPDAIRGLLERAKRNIANCMGRSSRWFSD